MPGPIQRFISYPKFGPLPVVDPRGKVSGVVTLTPIGHRDNTRHRMWIATDGAHVNDDTPAVDFRGESWLTHVLAELDELGTWHRVEVGTYDITRRASWGEPPATYAAAITAALLATAAAHVTPEMLRLGERANIAQDLHRVDEKRAELETELTTLNRRATDLRAALSAVEHDDDK